VIAMLELPVALQFGGTVFWGALIALFLFLALLLPYLIKENTDGKAELRPGTPIGTGDASPGRRGNPAPGQPDGQPDPYEQRARR
jgi:hypothetical protein